MLFKIIRFGLPIFAGMSFIFFLNSLIFFNNLILIDVTNKFFMLLFLFAFIPLMISFVISAELTFFKNFVIQASYFLSGLLVAHGLFIIFNDSFVVYNTEKAYIEIQNSLNISDSGSYGPFQDEFLKDKSDNNYEALSKYVEKKTIFKVAEKEVVAHLILSMNSNKDPILQQAFDKIIEDKVLSVQEVDDFNNLVIKHKIDSI